MADQDVVGSDGGSPDGSGRALHLAELLSREIDESWTPEMVKEYIDDFIETEHGCIKVSMIGDIVHLDILCVDPKERGKGHGKALVGVAEDLARTMHFRGVGVHTIQPGFFEHLGYQKVGLVPGAARGKDLIVMFKEISNVSYHQEAVM